MSCPFAGLATRYTADDERVSVRICSAVPYLRESDPDDLPLPSVCFSQAAWQACPHYLRLTQRKEVAIALGLDSGGTPRSALAEGPDVEVFQPVPEPVEAPSGPGERRRVPGHPVQG